MSVFNLYDKGRESHLEVMGGLYVHPVTRLLCYKRVPIGFRGGPFLKAQGALRVFGIQASSVASIRRYRVDGLRLWELRGCSWFIHPYRHVPERIVRVIARSDGRQVPMYSPAHYERVATKQASRKELRDAKALLLQDPLATR